VVWYDKSRKGQQLKSERMGTCNDAVRKSLQHQICRLAAD